MFAKQRHKARTATPHKANNRSRRVPRAEQLLFANVHQLLNEFRPWQARQDLIELMEAQIARRRATIAELQAAMAEACDSLREGFREIDAAEQAEAAAAHPQQQS